MDDFELRPARADDQATIVALVREARINPMSLDWRRFLVAISQEGSVIGCGQIKPHGDGSRELASIVVEEGWRGRGVARLLIRSLMQGQEPPLWLTCRSGLIPLYEKFGFEAVDPRHDPDVPPYFRRLVRVAKPFLLLAGRGESLAVMVFRGGAKRPQGQAD